MKTGILEELKQTMQKIVHDESKKALDTIDERIASLSKIGQDISAGTPEECYNYALAYHRILSEHQSSMPSLIGKDRDQLYDFLRCYELEPTIMKAPEWAYKYTLNVINGGHTNYPWPPTVWKEAEPYIMKDPKWAYKYTLNIINRQYKYRGERWEEAEPHIMKDPKWAYKYLKNIINDNPDCYRRAKHERWEEAEEYLLSNEEIAFLYARDYADMTVEELKAEVAGRKSGVVDKE